MKRRYFLQGSGLLPLGLMWPLFSVAGADSLYLYSANPGDGSVLVDAGAHSFRGAGHYLYPRWGQPRSYFVRAEHSSKGTELLFYSNDKATLLWRESLMWDEGQFAGRVVETLSPVQTVSARQHFPSLQLPVLPAIAT